MTQGYQETLVVFILDKTQDLEPSIARVFEQEMELVEREVVMRCYNANKSAYLWLNTVIPVQRIGDIAFMRTFSVW